MGPVALRVLRLEAEPSLVVVPSAAAQRVAASWPAVVPPREAEPWVAAPSSVVLLAEPLGRPLAVARVPTAEPMDVALA